MEYGIIDKVMNPSDAVAVSAGCCLKGQAVAGMSDQAPEAATAAEFAHGLLAADASCSSTCARHQAATAAAGLCRCLCSSCADPPHLAFACPQIERRDYEGMLRASQSQGRGARSGGAMAGADA